MTITPLDIVKRTPKTNCGRCGFPACLAFAAAVAKSGEDPDKCPYIDRDGLALADVPGTEFGNLGRQRDLALIEHLKQKVAPMDFRRIAKPLGGQWNADQPEAFHLFYLGRDVSITKNGILIDGREPEDPRDQILLYNYVYSGGGRPITGNWIGLESLPNSISKVRTLAVYCEERLAKLFDGHETDTIVRHCRTLHGKVDANAAATLGIIVPVLPRVPQNILYWAAEPDDGFEAKVKVLFDRNVPDYLDIESLVFAAERLADRLLDMMC